MHLHHTQQNASRSAIELHQHGWGLYRRSRASSLPVYGVAPLRSSPQPQSPCVMVTPYGGESALWSTSLAMLAPYYGLTCRLRFQPNSAQNAQTSSVGINLTRLGTVLLIAILSGSGRSEMDSLAIPMRVSANAGSFSRSGLVTESTPSDYCALAKEF